MYVDKLRNHDNVKLNEDFKVVIADIAPENCLHFSIFSKSNKTDLPSEIEIWPNDVVALHRSLLAKRGYRKEWF